MDSDNPHNLTFPYPKVGKVIRPAGQGCTSCVQSGLCPALYWWRRNNLKDPDTYTGRACLSWEVNPDNQVRTWTEHDLEEVDYQFVHGIAEEANRCGITSAVTGGDRSVEG